MEEVVPHDWRIENSYLLTADYPRLGIDPDEAAAARARRTTTLALPRWPGQ